VPQGIWFNRIDDPAKPFLSFLNVRWVLMPSSVAPPAAWRTLDEAEGLRLVENPDALARVFAPAQFRGEPDGATRLALLGTVQDFGERGVVPEGPGRWTTNGDAHVTLDSYASQSLVLHTEGTTATLVGTSIPVWPGWKAELDGHPLSLTNFNHAFVGFRVPPGNHRVRLQYLPDGFVRGLAVSVASALALAGWIWYSLQRKASGVPK
jgi:hypothetical protein